MVISFIALIILSVLSFTIIAEAKVNVDLYSRSNNISFFLFGIKVIQIDVAFIKGTDEKYELILKNGEKTLAELKLNELKGGAAKQTFDQAMPNPFYNLDIVEVEAYAQFGATDPRFTAVGVIILRFIFAAAMQYLKTTQRLRAKADIDANFNSRSILLQISGIFSLTVADIIYGIIFGKKGEKT